MKTTFLLSCLPSCCQNSAGQTSAEFFLLLQQLALLVTMALTMLTRIGNLRWLFMLSLQVVLSSAANSAASFLYPSTTQTLDIADTIVVEWSSDYTAPTLFTWMRNHTDNSGYQGKRATINIHTYTCSPLPQYS